MAESALSLVDRLRAALDRAAEIARATEVSDGPDQWWSANDLGAHVDEADTAFIVANGPASVLRSVAAHRRILERHAAETVHSLPDTYCRRCSNYDVGDEVEYPCDDVRDLAAVYFPEETTDEH